MKKTDELDVGGRRIALSNLDKVLYPGGRFRKGEVIDFYIRIADWILPHLKGRPVTLKRFPDGVTGEAFYEKDAPGFTPQWVRVVPVPRRGGGSPIRYIVIDDLATLVWIANLACLEIHPFLHCAGNLENPTHVVFDLDPGEGADMLACARVALELRELLATLGLESFAKVSGSKGLQVYVPLNRSVSYAVTGSFARAVARLLHERMPKLVVAEMSKSLRTNKVFIDWSQNTDYKTTVGVYSLRAKSHSPYVSMPVRWDELVAAEKSRDVAGLVFSPEAALERLASTGDLFAPVLEKTQELPQEIMQAFAERRAPTPRRASSLEKYRSMRDFSKTSEPSGDSSHDRALPRGSRQGSRRRFVVQKHAASHLHYDFRLEMHGALKSWAVPKGPSCTKDEARLARATEDHPLEYFDFEGIIPKGQYGGGTVMVWDIGTYDLIEGNYYRGFLRIHLDGHKLKGEWTLKSDADDRQTWRLIRSGPSASPVSASSDDESVLTGRSMREIASAADAVWQSNRSSDISSVAAKPSRSVNGNRRRRKGGAPAMQLDSLPAASIAFVAKQKASTYESGRRSGAWVKHKTSQSQELVVGGYIPGPDGFESLLVGHFEDRKLVFDGKIRNGFVPELRRKVSRQFARRETSECPFANLPEPKSARRGEALTSDVMKRCRWLRPDLVAQIQFTEWTRGGHLRHARFAGLRDDKDARDVVREVATTARRSRSR